MLYHGNSRDTMSKHYYRFTPSGSVEGTFKIWIGGVLGSRHRKISVTVTMDT